MRNSIKEIVKSNGVVLKNGEDIKQEAKDYFKEFLTHKPTCYHRMSVEDLKALIDYRCTGLEQEQLVT